MIGWGKGATAKNKIYYGLDKYGDSGVIRSTPSCEEDS